MAAVSDTDLILNPDGSVYHLALRPEDIGERIILVGDPDRVEVVSSMFDVMDVRRQKREFVTHTGMYKGKRVTALSTGIGCDNIDIVLNELDALVSMDLVQRKPLENKRRLELVRIGTSGALHEDIEPGSSIMARIACGFDGLYHFYEDDNELALNDFTESFKKHTSWKSSLTDPYFIAASDDLAGRMSSIADFEGITISTPGFYAPQFRSIRLKPYSQKMIEQVASFTHSGFRVNNFEMESSALYALSAMMGHQALTLCVAIANRKSTRFLGDYQPAVSELIEKVLNKLCEDEP